MRYVLTKKNSTKFERIFYETLKKLHIPFKHRWIIQSHEVDFLLGNNICIEISGHPQSIEKNNLLVGLGYVPIHLRNTEVKNVEIIKTILNVNKIKTARWSRK